MHDQQNVKKKKKINAYFLAPVLLFLCALLLTVIGLCVLCYYLVRIFDISRVLFYYVCNAVLHTLVAGLLSTSQ